MRLTCEVCEARLEIPTRGRSPRFCSSACRQKDYRRRRREQLPARMRELPRWTAADGKRPVTPTGSPASTTKPETWTAHAEVQDGPHGVMLGGGLACIDLDHCINRRGKVADWLSRLSGRCPVLLWSVRSPGAVCIFSGCSRRGGGVGAAAWKSIPGLGSFGQQKIFTAWAALLIWPPRFE